MFLSSYKSYLSIYLLYAEVDFMICSSKSLLWTISLLEDGASKVNILLFQASCF